MEWQIIEFNRGRKSQLVQVFDKDGAKRAAQFENLEAARECCLVIAALRIDTAFEGTQCIAVER